MRTSYFARYKGEMGVSTALGTPKWFTGGSYPDLFPTWPMINAYKQSDQGAAAQDAYIAMYHKLVLDRLDPAKIYDDLKYSVLLCYEASDKFCHRYLVAEWLQDNLDILVKEVE